MIRVERRGDPISHDIDSIDAYFVRSKYVLAMYSIQWEKFGDRNGCHRNTWKGYLS